LDVLNRKPAIGNRQSDGNCASEKVTRFRESGVIVSIRGHGVAYHIYLIRANGEVDRNGEENKQNERRFKREQ
jgi:hypothetical protein